MSLMVNVYLQCYTAACSRRSDSFSAALSLTAIFRTKCDKCKQILQPTAMQFKNVMIVIADDIVAKLREQREIYTLRDLKVVMEMASSVAYEASELLAFRQTKYVSLVLVRARFC
jgi:hypothetical protein